MIQDHIFLKNVTGGVGKNTSNYIVWQRNRAYSRDRDFREDHTILLTFPAIAMQLSNTLF